MLIPLRTDRPSKRRPITTELLIVSNLLVYLAALISEFLGGPNRQAFLDFGRLSHDAWGIQLISYQFLHDPHGLLHLGFNMLFLWVFGSAVEGRMGRLGFLGFYLIGGMVAGIGHLIASNNPVIGASGSVCAVTGAFLALFPRSRVMVLFFFLLIGVHAMPATWIIGLYMGLDLLNALFGRSSGVAYSAHLAGYAYGFALGVVLLALRILPHEEFDVFFLFRQWRRRAEFRRASTGATGGMYESASADTSRKLARASKKQRGPAVDPFAAERVAITTALAANDHGTAATEFLALLDRDPEAGLSEPQLSDIGNHLAAVGRDADAARVYERLLARYPRHGRQGEVGLLLAVLYGRRLNQPADALRHLDAVTPKLTSDDQRELADALRAQLKSELS